MNSISTKLSQGHVKWFKDFITWYKDNYATGIDIKILVTEHNNYMLGIIHEYLNKVYNVGILYDCYTYYIYIVNPDLKVNELIDKFKTTGEFTHVIIKHTNNKQASTSKVFEMAILRIIDEIHNQF